jgi:hypothetical protein
MRLTDWGDKVWARPLPGDRGQRRARGPAAQREATGKPALGRAAILKQHPHERPNRPKKSYAPLFHAASRKVRRDLYEGYRAFVAAFREGAPLLRTGNLAAVFPAGSFPPALPFVGG